MQKIYVLKYGDIGRDGVIMEAFKTKTSFRKHVRLEYPEAIGRNRHKSNELYWEWGDHGEPDGGWIMGEEVELR